MGERAGLVAKAPEVKQSNSNSRVRRTERLQSIDTPVDRILFLQRTAGNQAVSRLIRSGALQAKLRIGQPGDMYEQEADRVADAVMRMPEPGVQRQFEPEEEEEETLQTKPLANQITPLVQMQRQEEPEEEETLQAKPLAEEITPLVQRQVEPEEEEEEIQPKSLAGAAPEVTLEMGRDIQSIKGKGQPLSASERAFFEPRFGADFDDVRVHSDTRAAHVARSVNARAFTLGRNVVFGAGQYAPGMRTGRQLLAHELAHVLQQSGQARGPVQMRRDGIYGIQRKVTVCRWRRTPRRGKNFVCERWTPRRGKNFVFYRFRRNKRVRDKVWFRRFRSQFSSKYHFFYFNKAVLMSNLKYFTRLGDKEYREFVVGHRLAATPSRSQARTKGVAHPTAKAEMKKLKKFLSRIRCDVDVVLKTIGPKRVLANQRLFLMPPTLTGLAKNTYAPLKFSMLLWSRRHANPFRNLTAHMNIFHTQANVKVGSARKKWGRNKRLLGSLDIVTPIRSLGTYVFHVDLHYRSPSSGWMHPATVKFKVPLGRFKSYRLVFPPEKVVTSRYVCGPNVTKQVKATLAKAQSVFYGYNVVDKLTSCRSLHTMPAAPVAWDINDLHNNAWIHQVYRPECATKGAKPPCGSSIQVGSECYYAGSVNYVLFGKMCRMCHDLIKRLRGDRKTLSKQHMRRLIKWYKSLNWKQLLGLLWVFLSKRAKNYTTAKKWADAGFDGWPAGGTPPKGDRSNCKPVCQLERVEKFSFTWTPYWYQK